MNNEEFKPINPEEEKTITKAMERGMEEELLLKKDRTTKIGYYPKTGENVKIEKVGGFPDLNEGDPGRLGHDPKIKREESTPEELA